MKKGSRGGLVSRIGRAAGAKSRRQKLGSGMAGRSPGYGPVTRTAGRVSNAGRTGSIYGAKKSRPAKGSRYSTVTKRPVARGSLGKRYN